MNPKLLSTFNHIKDTFNNKKASLNKLDQLTKIEHQFCYGISGILSLGLLTQFIPFFVDYFNAGGIKYFPVLVYFMTISLSLFFAALSMLILKNIARKIVLFTKKQNNQEIKAAERSKLINLIIDKNTQFSLLVLSDNAIKKLHDYSLVDAKELADATSYFIETVNNNDACTNSISESFNYLLTILNEKITCINNFEIMQTQKNDLFIDLNVSSDYLKELNCWKRENYDLLSEEEVELEYSYKSHL